MSKLFTSVKKERGHSRIERGHLLPAGAAEKLLVSLANARFPDEMGGSADAIKRLRATTEKHWPDLWGWIDETKEQGELRAIYILKKIRFYLQKFWDSASPIDRDWYIHRLRDYHYRHLIQPQTKSLRAAGADAATVNKAIEEALDVPPPSTPFADSLLRLQSLAHNMLRCPNASCAAPYFIRQKQGQKYCTRECAQIAHRNDNRDWAAARRAAAKGGTK